MTYLHDHLEHQLHAAADELDLPPGDLRAIMARGRVRGQRRALASALAVALVAGTVASITVSRLGNRTGKAQSVASLGTTSGVTSAQAGDVDVAWQIVDPHSALGYATMAGGTTADGSLYAISTAPGVHDPATVVPNVLYRSRDGVNWDPATGPANAYLTDLSASGSQLYAVGTGPSTVADKAPLTVASSSDGGATWKNLALPIDMAAIDASSTSAPYSNIQVMSNAAGAVVVVQISDALDVTRYLPAGVTAPNGWVFTTTGVDLLGPQNPNPCPAGMTPFPTPTTAAGGGGLAQPTNCVSASAAGATASGLAAAYANPLKSAVGGPGAVRPTIKAVDPLDDHPVTHTYTWAQLGITGVVLQAALGQPFVFFTPNGAPLVPVSLPGMAANPMDFQLAASSTQFAVAAESVPGNGELGTEHIWTSPDGTTWTAAAAPPDDQFGPAAVGYLNGALTTISSSPRELYGNQGGGSPAVATLSPAGWSEVSLASLLGSTAGKAVQTAQAAIGPFGVVVDVMLVPVTGTNPPGNPEVELMTSRDGLTWSVQELDQLAGVSVASVANLAVTANTFLVTVQRSRTSPDANSPAPETVLVGAAR